MDTLLPEILSLIFEYLNTKQLIWAKRTCKKWRKVYQDNLWKYTINLEPFCNKITTSDLKDFQNVKTIKLRKCFQITGPYLKYLDRATNIDLSHSKINDKDLQYLKSVRTLNLAENTQLTNDCLEYIPFIEYLNIYGSIKITSKGLSHIKNAKNIIMCACRVIIKDIVENRVNNVTFYNCVNTDFEQLKLLKERCPLITIMKLDDNQSEPFI
ncbi:MAG: F-box domain protein [Barrevirus sp.]|uniref:F-box domain protein n=1 Tax=Barrevirus sp. TaxID=2487763 RepID=A0A3G4ZPH8_9VIRU|nr:MAG: F-box domain protein [Barrevirus sp.]